MIIIIIIIMMIKPMMLNYENFPKIRTVIQPVNMFFMMTMMIDMFIIIMIMMIKTMMLREAFLEKKTVKSGQCLYGGQIDHKMSYLSAYLKAGWLNVCDLGLAIHDS